jgi:hypothetical protein
MQLFTLTKIQFFVVALYAAAFPLAGLIGGKVQMAFLFATAPFLPIGYLTGGLAWQLFSTPKAYPFGLFAGILLQAWLLLALWISNKNSQGG